MLRAYFDTNVYDLIDKGDIPATEVEALHAALVRREIIAYLSLADVEELLGQWETDRPAAVRKLRIARDLVGFGSMLKQPADLLREAIQAYADSAPPPSPTLPRAQRRFLGTRLSKVADGSTRFNSVMSQIVADVTTGKEAFKAKMVQARDWTLAELNLKPHVLRQVSFEEFWARGATLWAEDFADHLGLAHACRERGLDGLLEVRSVRFCVGAAMSLVHSQVVGGRHPDFGDGYDLWHAVLASVADVFVTLDERLADHLARAFPVDSFRVVRSIPELLAH